MNLKEIIYSSLDSIRQNKMRSFLTLLGVIIGIFSIIGVMTAMNILSSSMETNLSSLGTNTFQVQKYPAIQIGNSGGRRKYHNRKNLTYKDYLKLEKKITVADYVSAEDWTNKNIIFNDKKTKSRVGIGGVTPEWDYTNNYILEEGRMITQQDIRHQSNVVIIGKDIIDVLMPQYYPIGQKIKIAGVKFKIIGIWESKGESFGESKDNSAVIPLTTHLKMFSGRRTSLNYCISTITQNTYDMAKDEVIYNLRTIRGVAPGEEDDFEIYSNSSLIESFNTVMDAVKLGGFVISSIALLAAGIGIMNIMLVSVSERTREIGIRKSIGAKNSDIMQQFLLEALILTLIGGLIGILLGILGGNILALVLKMSAVIPWDWIGIGIAVCSLIGGVFGTYPAVKAAHLDPIEALRH
ncbi:MAG: ABC transporter permease [Candidatus Marinimicrobia bacterium]|nr:ABC transporter permease [Candidatus Neomarinimicrobiota bacterium]